MKIKMSLRYRAIIISLLAIFVFGGLAVGSVLFYLRGVLIDSKEKDLELLVVNQSLQIERSMKKSVEIVETISRQKFIIDYLNGEKEPQDGNVLEHILHYDIGGEYFAIYVMDYDGRVLVSSNSSLVGNDYSFCSYLFLRLTWLNNSSCCCSNC